MQSNNVNECFEHISAYYNGKRTGHFLLVNTENYDVYKSILVRFQADTEKKCIYVSNYPTAIGLPDVDAAISAGCKNERFVIFGISQLLMLRGKNALENKIDELLEQPISGHGVILLDHCEPILSKLMNRDLRVEKHVVLVNSETSELPHIKLPLSQDTYPSANSFHNFQELLVYLENISDEKNKQKPEITVFSSLPSALFANSVYPVSKAAGVYDALTQKYPDIGGATEKGYGKDEQWNWLTVQMNGHSNFASLI